MIAAEERSTVTLPPRKSVHAWITGRVQGVAFRHHAREVARRRGVVGWVRNRPDGRVELRAEGTAEDVDALLAWIHAGGPPAGRVDAVTVSEREEDGSFDGFEIRR